MKYCYLEFCIHDDAALARLESFLSRVFAERALPSATTNRSWFEFFTPAERMTFWWPNESQIGDARERWGVVPMEISENPENDQQDWDLYSLFVVLRRIRGQYVEVSRIDCGRARILIAPDEGTIDGIESLEKLVTVFHHVPAALDVGCGREELELDSAAAVHDASPEGI